MNPRTRRLTIIAQDPEIKKDGKILRARVEIPAEEFEPGPNGYRVQVIDYDVSTNTLYIPMPYDEPIDGVYPDPFADEDDVELLNNPNFHCQNVYAIVMRTLAKFEFALGRRVNWSFEGHQLKVAPHAFADANAFYSREDRALLFGYFRSRQSKDKHKNIFSCLSHDVIVHETTHALLDGLRRRFTTPSSPEQAGFHEGFADVVAMLSIFSIQDVVEVLLENSDEQVAENDPNKDSEKKTVKYEAEKVATEQANPNLISVESLDRDVLRKSALFGLAEEMGQELHNMRGNALRRSINIKQLKEGEDSYLDFRKHPEYEEPHRCGELLVAALLNAFLEVWLKRIERLKHSSSSLKFLDRYLIAEQGKDAAEQLLTMAIRAIDYTQPTDLKFGDYLSALLTSDTEAMPDDSRYGYRDILRTSFAAYGITPASKTSDGLWRKAGDGFVYDRTHFDSLLNDENEVFRFIWDNREKFRIDDKAYTNVISVRPCMRVAPDGFVIRETVAEYIQVAELKSHELDSLDPAIGVKLPRNLNVTLYGSGTLIFDEYGRLKFHIYNRIFSQTKQIERLKYLWKSGYLRDRRSFNKDLFLTMHLKRNTSVANTFPEEF